MMEAVIYLLAIAGAEAVTAFSAPPWGALCYIVILSVIIVRSALVNLYFHQRLMFPLALVPLMRIISLTISEMNVPEIWLNLSVYSTLLIAAVVLARILKYSALDIGLNPQWLGTQLVVGGTGILLAFIGYPILRPEPLIAELTWQEVWLPALILLIYTGFVEELVFRGIIQRGAVEELGRWGIVYVSLLSAALYIGFLPVTWLAFVFFISLYFGWIVRETGSILGVALAHGLCNIVLYLIAPFF
jgi:membrane protease YdiL (CAAX protease family)